MRCSVKLKLSGIFAAIVLIACLHLQLVATAFARERGAPWSNRQLTIRIHDYAQIKSAVLLQAEQSAANMLKSAGVDVNWVECRVGETTSRDAACARPMTLLDVILNLLPRSMANRSDFRDEVFGVAVEGTEKDFGFFASVFYDKVKDCAVLERIDLAPFLGAVMAHELGHLLLGSHSHSGAGLMAAAWSRKEIHAAEQRGLAFAPLEAKQIQKAAFIRNLIASHEAVSTDASSTGTLADPSTKIQSSNEVPFRISSGYLIEVEGRIGANTNQKFVLDTGSTTSIIENHLADKIQLQRRRAESLNFNRMLAWEVATVPEIQLGPIKVQNSQVFVGRLGEYSEFTKKVDAITSVQSRRQARSSRPTSRLDRAFL
jgi:hypothetical protein